MAAVLPPRLSRWQMVKLLVPMDRRRASIVAALIVIAGTVPPAITWATGVTVGAIVDRLARPARASGSVREVVAAALVVAAMFAVQQLIGPALAVVAQRFARVVDRSTMATVIRSVTRSPGLEVVEDPAHQDLVMVGLGRSDWGQLPGGFVTGAADQWPRRIAGAGAVLLVARWNVWVALLLPSVSLVGLQAWRRSFFSVVRNPETDLEDVRAASYALGLAINPEFSRETRVFEMRPWLLQRHTNLWLRAMRPIWRHRTSSSYLVSIAIGANAAVRLLVLGVLGRAALRGELDAETVAVVAPAIVQASHLTWISGSSEMAMQRCLASAGAALALANDTGDGDGDGHDREVLPMPAPSSLIRFQDVTFTYRTGPTVLANLTVDIPVGRSLAVVGFNGAGKTTMVKLLAGLYRPTSGRITVDGEDLARVAAVDWQVHVAAIFQDFARYPSTVRENIGWGSPSHLDDEAGIVSAAEQAGAMPFIDGLHSGLDTLLDRRFVDGADASGGEWQRIAIARALFAVKHGASLLVLDEPTAQLDARAEADIYERFLDLTAGVTSIVVSHRFSTIRRADQIVVLEGGRISERGTHHELMVAAGRYAQLFRIQADALITGSPRADE